MANRSTGIYGHFGSFSATNQLPNVAGAVVQSSEVQVGDLAAVAGALYICTTATLGAAVWAAVGAPGGSVLEWAPELASEEATGLEVAYAIAVQIGTAPGTAAVQISFGMLGQSAENSFSVTATLPVPPDFETVGVGTVNGNASDARLCRFSISNDALDVQVSDWNAESGDFYVYGQLTYTLGTAP